MLSVKSITVGQILSILCLALLISACSSNQSKTKILIKELQKNLDQSSQEISIHTSQTLNELQDKTTRPETSERANYWFPKAQQIRTLTKEISDYIEHLKQSKEYISNEIQNIVVEYIKQLLLIEQQIQSEFSTTTSSFLINIDTLLPVLKLNPKPLLSSIQNSILLLENKIILFCYHHIGSTDGYGFFTSFETIVGQNATILKKGETLEINAGIGSYSKAAAPKINIDNKNLNIGDAGFATYKLKISENPGNYKIPVKISYINQVGFQERRIINVEYTVAKECN